MERYQWLGQTRHEDDMDRTALVRMVMERAMQGTCSQERRLSRLHPPHDGRMVALTMHIVEIEGLLR